MQLASYPVIRTQKFAETVAFYEDVFGFVPFYEVEGYVRLHHKDSPDVMIAIIHSDHPLIPASLHSLDSSNIFSFAIQDFDASFESVYYEGLEIIKEPTDIGGGVKHFMFADPYNKVVINVMNSVAVSSSAGREGIATRHDAPKPSERTGEHCECC